jgi:hypothetical protein
MSQSRFAAVAEARGQFEKPRGRGTSAVEIHYEKTGEYLH